jgi:hypothetical protein
MKTLEHLTRRLLLNEAVLLQLGDLIKDNLPAIYPSLSRIGTDWEEAIAAIERECPDPPASWSAFDPASGLSMGAFREYSLADLTPPPQGPSGPQGELLANALAFGSGRSVSLVDLTHSKSCRAQLQTTGRCCCGWQQTIDTAAKTLGGPAATVVLDKKHVTTIQCKLATETYINSQDPGYNNFFSSSEVVALLDVIFNLGGRFPQSADDEIDRRIQEYKERIDERAMASGGVDDTTPA